MMDTSDQKGWSHPEKIGKNANCPSCGYHGGGHVTVFMGDQIGRRCLECNSTWPIEVEEPTPTQDRPDYVHCVLVDHAGPRMGICGRELGFDFAFVSLEHAKNSETSGSRLVLCENCQKVAEGKGDL